MRSVVLILMWRKERLKAEQGKDTENRDSEVEQLDFEFVLFSSVLIDYDYIMALIAKYTQSQSEPQKQKMIKLVWL